MGVEGQLSTIFDELLSELKHKTAQESKEDVILFFAFDLVNSTRYKTLNHFGWAKVMNRIFKAINKAVDSTIADAQFWRIVGDEIIFVVRITNREQIYRYTGDIFGILTKHVKLIKSGEIFDSHFTEDETAILKLQNILSLKASAWIAVVTNSDNKRAQNILERYNGKDGIECIEFNGNDIDAGFRISKNSRDRRLTLSFELAYILSSKAEYNSKLHIITFRKLKGIWDNKLYPIIWFHDKDVYGKTLQESFYYDEDEEDDLTEEYYRGNNSVNIRNKLSLDNPYKALHKILNDNNLINKVLYLDEVIDKATEENKKCITNTLLEMHCVAVCFNKEEDAILIAKRSNNRKMLNNRWEFGCGKANLIEELEKTICQEYKEDFGININLYRYDERTDCQPIPIVCYELGKDSKEKHKGVIFIAKLNEKFDVDTFSPTNKHDKLRWIKEDEIEHFNEIAVVDFKHTLRIAFRTIHLFKK